jgi:hypothetical protein
MALTHGTKALSSTRLLISVQRARVRGLRLRRQLHSCGRCVLTCLLACVRVLTRWLTQVGEVCGAATDADEMVASAVELRLVNSAAELDDDT